MNFYDTLMWKEINSTPEILPKILEKNKDVMSDLVKAIKDSKIKNFVAAARGSSNNAITYFKYVLEVLTDYTVGLSAPSIITLYRGKINYSSSIVLGCSQSGMAEDVLEVIKKGNEQGAITVAITNNADSPIAKAAKYHIDICAGKEESVIATKSFCAELFTLIWLATKLSGNKENLLTLKHLNYDIKTVLPQLDKLTDVYSEKYRDTKDCFVLSRGFTYPVALETSLLLQETCYIQASGYAGSEFYHGPIASVNNNTPVIIYCAKNDMDEEMQTIIRADQVQMVEKMLNLNAKVLLVTNDLVLTGRFRRSDDALINFSVPEEFAIFAFTIFAQMLSCKISCLLGNNPDNPRELENTIVTK